MHLLLLHVLWSGGSKASIHGICQLTPLASPAPVTTHAARAGDAASAMSTAMASEISWDLSMMVWLKRA